MDYNKFSNFEKQKKENSPFLSLEEGETVEVIFIGAREVEMVSSFTGKLEPTINYTFKTKAGKEKTMNRGSLSFLNSFKNANINEGDLVELNRGSGKDKSIYTVKKIKSQYAPIAQNDIPSVDESTPPLEEENEEIPE